MTEQRLLNLRSAQLNLAREDSAEPGWACSDARGGRPSSPAQPAPTVRPGASAHIPLRGTSVSLDDDTGKVFVTDCARHIEGLRTDQDLKETWGLDEEQWGRLADNIALLNAVRVEREWRIRSGEAAREAAQRHFATAPAILNEILQNKLMSPRHRIEAARELRQVAANGPEATAPAEKFVITIDLGGDDKFVCEADIARRPPSTEEEEC
jgi:hypothetical protein